MFLGSSSQASTAFAAPFSHAVTSVQSVAITSIEGKPLGFVAVESLGQAAGRRRVIRSPVNTRISKTRGRTMVLPSQVYCKEAQ